MALLLFIPAFNLADILRWFLRSEVTEVYAQSNRIMHADTVKVETGGLTIEIVTDRGAVIIDAFKQNLTIYSDNVRRPVWTY